MSCGDIRVLKRCSKLEMTQGFFVIRLRIRFRVMSPDPSTEKISKYLWLGIPNVSVWLGPVPAFLADNTKLLEAGHPLESISRMSVCF